MIVILLIQWITDHTFLWYKVCVSCNLITWEWKYCFHMLQVFTKTYFSCKIWPTITEDGETVLKRFKKVTYRWQDLSSFKHTLNGQSLKIVNIVLTWSCCDLANADFLWELRFVRYDGHHGLWETWCTVLVIRSVWCRSVWFPNVGTVFISVSLWAAELWATVVKWFWFNQNHNKLSFTSVKDQYH